MPFSSEIKERAMVACGRRCCICHKFCGNNMEVHHIKPHSEGGSDDFDNAIPLCFDCHAIVRQYDPKHPKGIRFSEKELIDHRNAWYEAVKKGVSTTNEKNAPEPVRIVRPKGCNIVLKRVKNGQELMAYTQGISAMEYAYDNPSTQEEASMIAELVQKIRDLIDINDMFMEPTDSIMMAFTLNDDIKTMEKADYWLFCGVEKRTLTGGIGNPSAFPVLIIRILKSNNEGIIKAEA